MKLSETFVYDKIKGVRKPRKPCMTVAELARQVGTEYRALLSLLKNSKDAPTVKFKDRNRVYYTSDELLAWHARCTKGEK